MSPYDFIKPVQELSQPAWFGYHVTEAPNSESRRYIGMFAFSFGDTPSDPHGRWYKQ